VVPGHHDDLRVGKRGAQPIELNEGVQDRRVRRAHLMKHVTGDEHDVGRELDHLVQRARDRLRHVHFTLIDPTRSQPLILAESQVQIGEVDEAQSSVGRGRSTVGAIVLSGCAGGS